MRRALRALLLSPIRRPGWTIAAGLLTAALSVVIAARTLGVNSDTSAMISPDLAWRQAEDRMNRLFPLGDDRILVVIDAESRAYADSLRAQLCERLEQRPGVVRAVAAPDDHPYFRTNALAVAPDEVIETMRERLEQVSGPLGTIERDPSLDSLARLLGLASLAGDRAPAWVDDVGRSVADAFGRAGSDPPAEPLDWGSMLIDSTEPARVFLLVEPVLDLRSRAPALGAMRAVREAAAGLVEEGDSASSIRMTGQAAMSTDELLSASNGAGVATLLALGSVLVVLRFAVGSWRLVIASLVTLLVGLAWLGAFAGLAVGRLNLISVAFAVLYIGLGIDYAVHLCLRFNEALEAGVTRATAAGIAVRKTSPAFALCAVTTSIGFFSFVPTSFLGVSELGWIAGFGTYLSFFVSLSVLPALLVVFGPRTAKAHARIERVPAAMMAWIERRSGIVLAGAAVIGIVSIALAPLVTFDRNRQNLQNPEIESVAVFRDLLRGEHPPMTLSVLVEDEARETALRDRLGSLPEVSRVRSARDLTTAERPGRLRTLESLSSELPPDPGEDARDRPEFGTERDALELLASSGQEHVSNAARALLARTDAADAAGARALVEDARRLALDGVGDLLDGLRALSSKEPVGIADLPDELRERWITPDGERRLEITPSGDMNENDELWTFVDAVLSVAPGAVGPPVSTMRAGETMARAFAQALITALLAVFVIVLVVTRRAVDAAMVIAPLVLAGLMTGAASVTLGVPFNFANVIALPLMLGVGVDSGIHMVHRARSGESVGWNSTSRAVLFSLLTTICSFGSLALSEHRGMASMGTLLTVAIGITMVCSLVLLPALLTRAGIARGAQSGVSGTGRAQSGM